MNNAQKNLRTMVKHVILLISLSIMVSTGTALAHGVTVDISIEGGVVILGASYSPTQPLVDASVFIYSPAEPENEWQTGKTDRTGHFAFIPDAEGEWSVVIDDQKGHMKKTTIVFAPDLPEESEIAEETFTKALDSAGNGLNTSHKIVIGLSLLIGITGLFYGLKVRQERKKNTGN
jgi:nickel transport protein